MGVEVLQTTHGCDSVLTINLAFAASLGGRILGDAAICAAGFIFILFRSFSVNPG